MRRVSARRASLVFLSTVLVALLVSAPWAQAQPAEPELSAAAAEQAAEPEPRPEAVARLLEALRDDAARERLIRALEAAEAEAGAEPTAAAASAPSAPATAAPSPAAEAEPEPETVLLADAPTAAVANDLADWMSRAVSQSEAVIGRLTGALSGFSELGALVERFDAQTVVAVGWPLALMALATWTARIFLSRLSHPLIALLNDAQRAVTDRQLRRAGVHIGAMTLRAGVILLAYAVGLGLDIAIFGEQGRANPLHQMYLAAFLTVGLGHVAAQFAFAPRAPELRIAPLSDAVAELAESRSIIAISLLGFGVMFLAPLAAEAAGARLGMAVRAAVLVGAAAFAIVSIWAINRAIRREREALGAVAATSAQQQDVTAAILRLAGRFWAPAAMFYVLAMLVVAIARPVRTLPFLIEATAYSAVAIALGVAASALFNRVLRSDSLTPARLRGELPQFERRLSTATPKILTFVRLATLIAVVLAVADAWYLADVGAWIRSGVGGEALASLATAAGVVIVGYVVWLSLGAYVEYRLSDRLGVAPTARERTLLPMVFSAASVVTVIIVAMTALSELGVNIAPLIAGAGVVGLAIGFGAQTLVRDIITGVFIQLENAMNEGDVVTVAGVTGTVESLSLRCVNVRDLAGTLHVTPFSEVTTVSNFMRGYAYHLAEVGVAYKENVDTVKVAMRRAFARLREDALGAGVLEDLDMHGVVALADSAVVIRARIKTRPGAQWAIGRRYTELVKEQFDVEGIEIPFPHMTLVAGVDKAGRSQLELGAGGAPEPVAAARRTSAA